jgi:hypothetical protein
LIKKLADPSGNQLLNISSTDTIIPFKYPGLPFC